MKSDCTDGTNPSALVMDKSGDLFGTTESGVVFALYPTESGKWEFKVLRHLATGDGTFPRGQLVVDSAGNLYVTTSTGGAHGYGAALELSAVPGKSDWSVKVLYQFCSRDGCADGGGGNGLTYAGAATGALYDGVSPLYGTTGTGGATGGTGGGRGGAVYELIPGTKWTHKVLYTFCFQLGCADGESPSAGLIVNSAGNLFGTTSAGGTEDGGSGAIFELVPNAKATKWTDHVLYSFCTLENCADGLSPGTLLMDGSGNMFGNAQDGGKSSHCPETNDCGTAFELAAGGGASGYSVLYDFCSQASCTDGANPTGALIADTLGNLFGTTTSGGRLTPSPGGGTVFEVSGSSFSTLYEFCKRTGCTDGESPYGALISDSGGDLFGVTLYGGAHTNASSQGGTIFELVK